ncbi:pirin family protein [Rufibacter tibetensis]|uniref:Pirin n=1 Tax=Rufibacter tibetensis TaxID=512763 RepID=A0A0P0CUB7_9BACT|nr:pirin family protein [Rufibacter tibetensis]ALI98875.1 hypothetical protein DC20_07670 [Rufibacter tibetensis]
MATSTYTIYKGTNTLAGGLLVNRLLPNTSTPSIGAFVLLEHVYPVTIGEENTSVVKGETAHPHRGMVTLNYVLSGSLAHSDSQGNHATIQAGGVQWLKAGNGILHEETPSSSGHPAELFHALQFWINLPATHKKEEATHRSIQAQEVPELELPAYAGKMRLLLGGFGCSAAVLETFNKEFIYHIRLNPKSSYVLTLKAKQECAAFAPAGEVEVNGEAIKNSELILFGQNTTAVEIKNGNIAAVDVFLFGSEAYREQVVSEGPFVMNTKAEIAEAYRDFFDQKYGQIPYLVAS